MRINTTILFIKLVKALHPELICDIGSRDAYHAMLFRRFCKEARIIAFEANLKNVYLMRENEEIKKAGIEIQQQVVWNKDGIVNFYIENLAPSGVEEWRTGISSVRKKKEGSLGATEIESPSVRLDTFIQNQSYIPENIALWIDVEGAGYEVLEGMEGIQDKISIIHVEVETQKVWEGQKLKSDVEGLMKRMGFISLARGFSEIQPDLVFLNKRLYEKMPFKFKIIVFLSVLSYFKQLSYKLICQFLNFPRVVFKK